MRKLLVPTFAAVALVSGCAVVESLNPFARPEPVPAVFRIPEAEVEWLLIAPPERQEASILLETLERLPGPDASLPAQGDPYSGEAWRASGELLQRLKDQGSAAAQADLLAASAYDEAAPRHAWRQVRRFDARERCETTLADLRAVTREYSRGIAYRPAMPLDDLQFLILERHYRPAACVPANVAMRIEAE